MHASLCQFGLPCHAVGSGYEYTVSKGSDCGHCALNHSGPTGSEDAISLLTWTNYQKKKTSLCKAAAWARTGTLLSASAHGEVEVLGREWLAWEMGGLGIYTFRVKELHAHSQDWLPRMLCPGSPLCRGRLLGLVSQWDPIGSLSPPTTAAGLLTSGHSFPRALFSPWEPQVLFTREFTDGAAPRRTDVLSLWSALI